MVIRLYSGIPMKWYSLLISVSVVLACHTITFAQNYKQTKVRGLHGIYIYTYTDSTIFVNKMVPVPKDTPERISGAKYVIARPISRSVNEVFSEKKLNKLLAEKLMIAVMYLDSTGKIKSVQFQLKRETKVRPLEIEKLEAALRRNVLCTFSMDENKKAAMYGPLVQGIVFRSILNKTFLN